MRKFKNNEDDFMTTDQKCCCIGSELSKKACKEVKSDVLISNEVKLRLSENLPTEEVKDFQVRGRDKKITLHKLVV